MKQDKFKERAERLGITQKYLWQVEDFFYMGIWIKDVYQDGSMGKVSGRERRS